MLSAERMESYKKHEITAAGAIASIGRKDKCAMHKKAMTAIETNIDARTTSGIDEHCERMLSTAAPENRTTVVALFSLGDWVSVFIIKFLTIVADDLHKYSILILFMLLYHKYNRL